MCKKLQIINRIHCTNPNSDNRGSTQKLFLNLGRCPPEAQKVLQLLDLARFGNRRKSAADKTKKPNQIKDKEIIYFRNRKDLLCNNLYQGLNDLY